VFAFRTDAPDRSDYSKHRRADNSGIGLPVRGPSVPASGGRPDFLGVPESKSVSPERSEGWKMV
jgi:hypothetical protein